MTSKIIVDAITTTNGNVYVTLPTNPDTGEAIFPNGNSSWKEPVRVATTADVSPLSGLLYIDDISVVAGDRVLVKDQAAASENGIYIAATGAWIRASDADANSKVTLGMSTMVVEGSQSGTQWCLRETSGPISLGSTELYITQFREGKNYVAGSGISIDGDEIFVDRASYVAFSDSSFLGDGVATIYVTAHSFNTRDVVVQVYEVSTGLTVACEAARISDYEIQFTFLTPPPTNSLRCVILG